MAECERDSAALVYPRLEHQVSLRLLRARDQRLLVAQQEQLGQ